MGKNKQNKKGIVGKVCKIIFFSFAFIILLIAGIIMYKANSNPAKVPDIFGYKPMIVLSSSMETSIHKGDLVFVKTIDTNKLKRNDIIAFRTEDNKVTTHRIINIKKENDELLFETKGDANNTEDSNLVKENKVEGIYKFKIVYLGKFLLFLKNPMGLAIVLLSILVLGFLVLSIINITDNIKNKKAITSKDDIDI